MRKLTLVIILVLVIVSVAVPAMAGKGNPATEQQGNETGKAQQAGPRGPNYGKQTPTIPTHPTPTPTPTAQVQLGKVYRVYLPFVANRVAGSVVMEMPESVSPTFSIQPK